MGLEYYKGIRFDKVLFFSIEAEKRAAKIEPYAMEWLFTENDFSDKFLEFRDIGALHNVCNGGLPFLVTTTSAA